jgi:hypothetical protein
VPTELKAELKLLAPREAVTSGLPSSLSGETEGEKLLSEPPEAVWPSLRLFLAIAASAKASKSPCNFVLIGRMTASLTLLHLAPAIIPTSIHGRLKEREELLFEFVNYLIINQFLLLLCAFGPGRDRDLCAGKHGPVLSRPQSNELLTGQAMSCSVATRS